MWPSHRAVVDGALEMDAPKVDPTITGDRAMSGQRTRTLVQDLQRGGLSRTEAGNLAALSLGIAPTSGGWTVAELDGLQFVRWLVVRGRLRG
jgi:hypothetical protein